MPITPSLQPLLLQQASAGEIAAQAAREGVRSLRQAGMSKVAAGDTTIEEVMAATHE
jgi:type IV pilus assembly protein PilB